MADGGGDGARGMIAGGAVLAGVAVACGAFGAHALRGMLGPAEFGWWHTAVEYQMWHGLALVALGLAGKSWARVPAGLLGGGAAVFSATLYTMALGGPRWLGAVTPLGGLLMMAGWAVLAWRALTADRCQG